MLSQRDIYLDRVTLRNTDTGEMSNPHTGVQTLEKKKYRLLYMPSIAVQTEKSIRPRRGRPRKLPGRPSARSQARRPAKNYNKQKPRNFQTKTSNMLQIKTLTPKEQLVSIQYKTVLDISSMGYSTLTGKGATGTIIRINLANPTYGTAGNLVDVLDLGSLWVNPSFTRSNSELNLSNQLTSFFDVYQKGVVVSSNSQVRIKSKPNQKLAAQSFENVAAQGTQGDAYPYDENHMPYLKVNEPTLDGDSYVWSVKQRKTGLLIDTNTEETATYHQLTNDLPGIKMRQLTYNVGAKNDKSVLSSARFTPRFFGLKDWRDNIAEVQFMPGMSGPPANFNQLKTAYHYVGICNRQTPLVSKKPQAVVAEITLNFDCLYFNRNNDYEGGDDPVPQVPHMGEL